jgi:hypothetical protein
MDSVVLGLASPVIVDVKGTARSRFGTYISQLRMLLSFTPLRCQACDQWNSSRVFTPLTGYRHKFGPNTEGTLNSCHGIMNPVATLMTSCNTEGTFNNCHGITYDPRSDQLAVYGARGCPCGDRVHG